MPSKKIGFKFLFDASGFTLVELIVVITILTILGTIGFTSIQGYASSARDSVRISDMVAIEKGLELFNIKTGIFPVSDGKYVTVAYSGTQLFYQGYVGENISRNIGLSSNTKDPLDSNQYTYSVDMVGKKYDLVGFVENSSVLSFFPPTYAAGEYSDRNILTKGNYNLTVVANTGSIKNTPLQYLTGSILYDISSLDSSIYGGYKNCKDIKTRNNSTISGMYQINPTGTSVINIQCDMQTEGGGWTIFQKRTNGSVDFYRNWNDYKNGFGNPLTEYWIGNDNLNILTSTFGATVLRVDMQTKKSDGGVKRYAQYQNFSIGNELSNYFITLGGFSGDVGSNAMPSSQAFSTFDRDNDTIGGSCAIAYRGAWWYSACHSSNLNGSYLNGIHTTYANGANWYGYRGIPSNTPCEGDNSAPSTSPTVCLTHPSSGGHFYSLPTIEMKLRS